MKHIRFLLCVALLGLALAACDVSPSAPAGGTAQPGAVMTSEPAPATDGSYPGPGSDGSYPAPGTDGAYPAPSAAP